MVTTQQQIPTQSGNTPFDSRRMSQQDVILFPGMTQTFLASWKERSVFLINVAVTHTFLAFWKELSTIPLLLLSQVDLDILQQQGLASRVAAERMRADMETLVCAQEAKALEVEAKLDAEEERLGRGAARLDADEARWVTMEQPLLSSFCGCSRCFSSRAPRCILVVDNDGCKLLQVVLYETHPWGLHPAGSSPYEQFNMRQLHASCGAALRQERATGFCFHLRCAVCRSPCCAMIPHDDHKQPLSRT